MEDKKTLISVIVPVYNVEQYLSECVDSILEQTYKNLEIILVDDGSTDNSGILCDRYSLKDERVKVIHKVNGGLSDARNKGIEAAKGQYIAFVDSDDYIDPDMYETLLRLCLEYKVPVSAVRWGSFESDFNDPKMTTENIVKMTSEQYMELMLGKNKEYYSTVSVCDRLYEFDMIKNLRFPTGKYYEDIVYSTNAMILAKECVFLDKIMYHYRIRKDSITDGARKGGIDKEKYQDQLEQEIIQMALLEKYGYHDLKQYCEYMAYVECLRYYVMSKKMRKYTYRYLEQWKESARYYVKTEKKKDTILRVRLSFVSIHLYAVLEMVWLKCKRRIIQKKKGINL